VSSRSYDRTLSTHGGYRLYRKIVYVVLPPWYPDNGYNMIIWAPGYAEIFMTVKDGQGGWDDKILVFCLGFIPAMKNPADMGFPI